VLVIDFDPSVVETWLCEVPIPRGALGGATATVPARVDGHVVDDGKRRLEGVLTTEQGSGRR
jgi:hypothetical protein